MKAPPADFYEIFNQYHDRLKRFVAITVKNDLVVDDIVQEVFISAHEKFETLKDDDKIGAWLFRIAYRHCLDHFRRQGRNTTVPLADRGSLEAAGEDAAERDLQQHQMSVCVQNQMLLLPENYRTVLWLFDALGFQLKEIADILDLSVENVKVRLHRARKSFKSILNQQCSFERDDRNVLVCEPKDGVDWQGNGDDQGLDLMDFGKNRVQRPLK